MPAGTSRLWFSCRTRAGLVPPRGDADPPGLYPDWRETRPHGRAIPCANRGAVGDQRNTHHRPAAEPGGRGVRAGRDAGLRSTIEPVLLDVRLQAEDFYRDRHRTIYEAIIRLNEDANPVDVLTVSEALAKHGQLETIGGRDVVASLAAKVPAPGSASHYAQIVKQNSLMRRLDSAAKQIQASVAERDGEPSEMVEQAERLLFQVAHEERAVDFREIGEILHEEIDKLEALASGTSDITGTPSGFRDLDDKTGGFQPGNLIVIAARPAMGKSTLVCDFAQNVAMKHQKPVALFSLEMSEMELAPTASSARSPASPPTGCARARSRRRTGRRSSRPATSSSPRPSGSTTPPTSDCSSCAPRPGACTPRRRAAATMAWGW